MGTKSLLLTEAGKTAGPVSKPPFSIYLPVSLGHDAEPGHTSVVLSIGLQRAVSVRAEPAGPPAVSLQLGVSPPVTFITIFSG